MEKTREYYIELLQQTAGREGRLPRKSDFSEEDVNRIKGFFGPWPWALEAAGLKESKQETRIAENRARRQRSREKREQLKNEQKEQ